MPIYEYRCPSCGGHVEALVRSDDPAPRCSACDSVMERVLSVTGGVRMGGEKPSGGPCCGDSRGCDNPKRCCGG
jgi:putative FmdB family regulatory protein